VFLAGGLVVLALAVRFAPRQVRSARPAQPPPIISTAQTGRIAQVVTVRPSDKSAERLKQAYEAARRIPDAATARRQFAELRATFFSLPTNEAFFAIRQFLDSKADAPTHLGFKLAGNGLLEEAPTWRIFLLDELARLDPAAAGDYAKVVRASMDSPDEWAVALRNLARGDASADARALLERKTSEMLGNELWRKEPSVGFLEAFDVAVYFGGTSLLPTLTDSTRLRDNSAVAHASFLALDRLVINEPTVTLAALQGSPDLMTGRESSRANYFARADAGDPLQRQILESYLLDERIGPRKSMRLPEFTQTRISCFRIIS
jgi:hypothetical protein